MEKSSLVIDIISMRLYLKKQGLLYVFQTRSWKTHYSVEAPLLTYTHESKQFINEYEFSTPRRVIHFIAAEPTEPCLPLSLFLVDLVTPKSSKSCDPAKALRDIVGVGW